MKRLACLLLVSVSAFAQASGVGNIWSVVSGTLQSGATASGNGTALSISGLSSASLTVNCSVACSGGTTINFEASQDGTNYVAIVATQLGTSTLASTVVNQGTTITVWETPIGGLTNIRARISGYSAGTITVTASATAAPYNPVVINSNGVAGTDARSTATDNTALSVVSILKQISASVQSPPLVQQSLRVPLPMVLNVPLGQAALPVYETRPAPNYDPCQGPNKANVPVSTSSNVQLLAGVAGRQIRICGGLLVATTAGSFSLVEGTGSVCATGIAGVIGSTTAANGPAVAANGGFLLGNGGATNAQANTPGNNICILLTGTGLIAGNIEYAY